MSGLEKDGKRKRNIKGEPEEAAAEIEAGGRRKEIADEAIIKLRVYRPKGRYHRLRIVEIETDESRQSVGAFLFFMGK